MPSKLFSVCLFLLIGVADRVTIDAVWLCPAGGAGVIGAKPYQIEALTLHNQYRAKHNSPPLRMDSTLNALAEQCAVYYALRKNIDDHSCPYKKDAGENLQGGPGVWSQDEFGVMSPKNWYSEISEYHYNAPRFSMYTGHFTQVVWKSSLKFGYAATTIDGFSVGVGLYEPRGNYPGVFRQNVLPAIS